MDKEKVNNVLGALQDLGKQEGFTLLAFAYEARSGAATDVILGKSEDLINGMVNLVASVYEEMDEEDRQEFMRAMKFVLENMDAMLFARALGMAVNAEMAQ